MAPPLGPVTERPLLDADQEDQLGALRRSVPHLANVPLPGRGRTSERWRSLFGVGRLDLAQARLVEGHLDALAILHELGRPDLIAPGQTWGVWAAEPHLTSAERGAGGWHLHGTKAFCSGAGGLDRALVTATSANGPVLVAIDARAVRPDPGSWHPLGMQRTASFTVGIDLDLPDDAVVGGPAAYTERPGFWHGGAGVAACWLGGAEGVLQPLANKVAADDDRQRAATFGRLRVRLDAARALLAEAAATIDEVPDNVHVAQRTALAVRIAVEESARAVLDGVGVALGARAFCSGDDHARRVADLTVYLRQLDVHGATADLGRLAAERPG